MKNLKKKENASEFIMIMKKFFKINKMYIKILVLAIILILSENFLKVVNNILLGWIIDNTSLQNINIVLTGIVIAAVIQVLRAPINYLVTYYVNKLSEKCIYNMRKYTYDHISKGSIQWLESSKMGDILTKVNNNLGAMSTSVNQFLTWEVTNMITFIVGLIACFIISWKLTIISFIIIPVFAFLQAKTGQPIVRLSRERAEAEGKSASIFVDFLNGLTISKAFGLENFMYERYRSSVEKTIKCNVKSFSIEFLMLPLQMLMEFIPQIIMLLLGTYLVIEGNLTFGSLFSFIFLSSSVTEPINNLSWEIRDIYNLYGLASRIFNIWNVETEDEGGEVCKIKNDIPVVFEHVQFGYNNESTILKDISFTINKNEKIALVGMSGSGKSTILKLIPKFYQKNSGTIKMFGHNIEDWNTKALREEISYVDQDTFLFPISIYDNVALGNKSATKEQILEVIKLVGLDKLDIYSEVGERGVRLSGGQMQRVAIARALLKDVKLLILDEPTSALDTESEYYVNRALDKFTVDKACIIIAHRLSAIRNVDRILCVDSGVIIQEGSHEELINQEGIYRKLYENQLWEGDKDE